MARQRLSSPAAELFPSELWTRIGTFAEDLATLWALTTTCRAAQRARQDPALAAGWLVQSKGRDVALSFAYPSDFKNPGTLSDHTLAAVVSHALRLGAAVDGAALGRRTALVSAARHGHAAVIKALLEGGADPTARSAAAGPAHGCSAIGVAACKGHAEALAALLSRVSDQKVKDRALASAVGHGRAAAARAALSAGADPNAWDPWGHPLLTLASGLGQPDVVEVLLETGAAPNAAGRDGRDHALSWAVHMIESCSAAHAAVVAALLRAGADASLAGGTSLFAMPAAIGRVEVVEALLAGGLSPVEDEEAGDAQPESGRSALAMAASYGTAAAVEALIRGGARPCRDRSPLLLLAVGDCAYPRRPGAETEAVVRALLAAGADPNAALPGDDETPLTMATARGHTAVVEALLAAGARPDAARRDGVTPLKLAVRTANVSAVQALLAAGARPDPGLLRSRFQDPTLAARHGRPSVESVLLPRVAASSPTELVDLLLKDRGFGGPSSGGARHR